jgi:hypothetical protein
VKVGGLEPALDRGLVGYQAASSSSDGLLIRAVTSRPRFTCSAAKSEQMRALTA